MNATTLAVVLRFIHFRYTDRTTVSETFTRKFVPRKRNMGIVAK
jgi:hypothetical protein